MTGATRLTVAGVACVGSAYGMARYGFGLLLPEMRAALALTDATIGLIAAAGYATYLAVSLLTGGFVARFGPRRTVLAAGACGVTGMLLAAAAPNGLSLGIAVAIAGASAALAFPPFADAIAASVPEAGRGRALAWTSSGTGAGVAAAAPLAVLADDWRLSWILFAVAAASVTLLAARVVPAHPHAPDEARKAAPTAGRPESTLPLLASAVLVGLGAAVFWTWAVDRVASVGHLGPNTAQALLAIVGVASLAGALAADLTARIGLRTGAVGCGVLLATALLAVGLAPGALVAATAAAIFFGAAYNVHVAILGLWSMTIFRHDPARGLAAVMSAMGVGFLAGPLLAAQLDQRLAFLLAAALLAAGGALGLGAPADDGDESSATPPAADGSSPHRHPSPHGRRPFALAHP